MSPPNTNASDAMVGSPLFEPKEPPSPPGMPKNHAPGRWVSNDWPPRTAPVAMAALPASPSRAVRSVLSSRASCPGTSEWTFGGDVEVVVALGDTSSIGDSLVQPWRRYTAGTEVFMKL